MVIAMPLLIRNLVLGPGEPEATLLKRVARRLRVEPKDIATYGIVRRSIDARGGEVRVVYNVEAALRGSGAREQWVLNGLRRSDVVQLKPKADEPLKPGQMPLDRRPVVIGFGPAGMFAALLLAEHGYRPLILERGHDVARRGQGLADYYGNRHFHDDANLLFGEGGAGTYSDGKLYSRRNDSLGATVFETFVRHGADPNILIEGRPHIGSDRLPEICRGIRQQIEQLGGEVRFGVRVTGFESRDGQLVRLQTADGESIDAGPTILAIGHSARDTIRCLHEAGVALEAKPFQLGLRIEHSQELVNRWQYGDWWCHPALPPADYQVIAKRAAGDRDVFSFCMCPGGTVLPAHESAELICVNGGSNANRNAPTANSGLVTTVTPDAFGDDPLAGMAIQQRLEHTAWQLGGGDYSAPVQRAADFVAGRPSSGDVETSYPLGTRWADLRQVLPEPVSQALAAALAILDQRMPGYAGPDAILLGPESRASSPVRIVRDHDTRQSPTATGLYPVGEGAGYAGGIVSAAVDGLRSAQAIVRQYRPAE